MGGGEPEQNAKRGGVGKKQILIFDDALIFCVKIGEKSYSTLVARSLRGTKCLLCNYDHGIDSFLLTIVF